MIARVFAFVSFYLQAQSKYRIHSPHLYDFVMNVVEQKIDIPSSTKRIEGIRSKYQKDHSTLDITDLGAGSNADNSLKRSIASIVRSAVSGTSKCQFLYRIARHYEAKSILELGTSLGIASSYLAHAASLTTIEGCPNISGVARKTLDESGQVAECLVGEIEDHLKSMIKETRTFDLVFADGNHQKEPTLHYFDLLCQLLPSSGGVIVFDDIYWSRGMTEAWQDIRQDDRVIKSIDLFELGIVYVGHAFDQKEHHALIKAIYKPWQTGLFKSA